jgi:ribulose-phosphate 3-epimerase
MAIICPTVTAFDMDTYNAQVALLATFAKRIHIDLMDGEFAPTTSPTVEEISWPADVFVVDVHLMFQRPMEHVERLIALKPHLVVVHAEADVDHAEFVRRMHGAGIKAGLSLLQATSAESVLDMLGDFDHVMIFSGNLGHHGGSAVDFGLLGKAKQIRAQYPAIEISWDGGISDQNAQRLVDGDIQVLNTGGYIHKAPNPAEAYAKLQALVA